MDTIYGIDIGSNSVRLVKIKNGKTLYKLTDTTQVSQDLSKNGFLLREAMDRTLSAVANFTKIAKKDGKTPFVFATEAFRRAVNGGAFAKEIGEKCGVSVDIISGELEARLGYIGAGGLYKRNMSVIDIGGASTELVSGRGSSLDFAKSMPLGVVILKDNCGKNIEKLSGYCNEKLSMFGDARIKGKCIGIGGTCTSLAAIDLKLAKYDPKKIEGHRLTLKRLSGIIEMFSKLSIEEIKGVPGVQEKRADVITGGAVLLSRLLSRLNKKEIYISESDNLEGYAFYKGYTKSPHARNL